MTLHNNILTEWLSGSGEAGDIFAIIAHFSQADASRQRRSRCPLEPMLGAVWDYAGINPSDLIHF
jgi:hypothetical protein